MATKTCKCGTEVEAGTAYCPTCGERVDMPTGPVPTSGEAQPETAAAGASPGQDQRETAPASAHAPARKLRQRLSGRGAQETERAEGSQEEYIWRYAVRDMNVAWLGNAVLTALILVVAFVVWDKLQAKVAEGVGQWFWLAVVLLCALLWLWQFGKLVYRKTIRYRLTPTHLYDEKGILRRETNTMELWEIRDIQHSQSLLEKLVCGGVGTIRIVSDDPGDPLLVLRGIAEHRQAFSLINEYRQRARDERVVKGL